MMPTRMDYVFPFAVGVKELVSVTASGSSVYFRIY